MDRANAAYYASHAADCAARYETAPVDTLHDLLRKLARHRPRALDIGGGSGRDAALLRQLGCHTTYADACSQMRVQALQLHPELAEQAVLATFPLPDRHPWFDQPFDLILAAGLIMHLDDRGLQRFAHQIPRLLTPGGHLVLSHSNGRNRLGCPDTPPGRQLRERPPEIVQTIFEQAGLTTLQRIDTPDSLGRNQLTWTTHVLQMKH